MSYPSNLKFKVWDGKKMLFPGAPRHISIGAVSWGFWDGNELLVDSSNDDARLLQWTGFKDKNNAEVYDLDILNWRNTNFLVNFRFGSYQLDGIDPKCWCSPYFYSHVRSMKRVGSLLEPLGLEIDIKPEVLEVRPELGGMIP